MDRRKTRQKFLQIAVSVPVVQYISSHVFVFGEKSQVIIEQRRHVLPTELAARLHVSHELKEVQVVGQILIFVSNQILHLRSVGQILIQDLANSLQVGRFVKFGIEALKTGCPL